MNKNTYITKITSKSASNVKDIKPSIEPQISNCIDRDERCSDYTGWVGSHPMVTTGTYCIVGGPYPFTEWDNYWLEPGMCCAQTYNTWDRHPNQSNEYCSSYYITEEHTCPDFNSAEACCVCGGGDLVSDGNPYIYYTGRCYDPNWWTVTLLNYIYQGSTGLGDVYEWDPFYPGPWSPGGIWEDNLIACEENEYNCSQAESFGPGLTINSNRVDCNSMGGLFISDSEVQNQSEACCCVPEDQYQDFGTGPVWDMCDNISNQYSCDNHNICQWIPGFKKGGRVQHQKEDKLSNIPSKLKKPNLYKTVERMATGGRTGGGTKSSNTNTCTGGRCPCEQGLHTCPTGQCCDYSYAFGGGCITPDKEVCMGSLDTAHDQYHCKSCRTQQNQTYSGSGRDCDPLAEVCLSIGNVDTDAGTLDIYMINNENVRGFQFELFGIKVLNSGGGSAEAADVYEMTSPTTVMGFSMSGTSISIGSHVLTQVSFEDFDGTSICFGTTPSNNVVSDSDAEALYTDWGDCYSSSSTGDTVCNDAAACNYNDAGICWYSSDDCGCDDPGATLECGCSPLYNWACDCNWNILDCLDVCGGSTLFDECGICGGDGSTCPEGCNGEVDECGVCNGDGSACDSCQDTHSNSACNFPTCNLFMDCAGICGGDSFLDNCGVCNGDGSSCICDNVVCLKRVEGWGTGHDNHVCNECGDPLNQMRKHYGTCVYLDIDHYKNGDSVMDYPGTYIHPLSWDYAPAECNCRCDFDESYNSDQDGYWHSYPFGDDTWSDGHYFNSDVDMCSAFIGLESSGPPSTPNVCTDRNHLFFANGGGTGSKYYPDLNTWSSECFKHEQGIGDSGRACPGVCRFPGCTDEVACNYDGSAIDDLWINDGSCDYSCYDDWAYPCYEQHGHQYLCQQLDAAGVCFYQPGNIPDCVIDPAYIPVPGGDGHIDCSKYPFSPKCLKPKRPHATYQQGGSVEPKPLLKSSRNCNEYEVELWGDCNYHCKYDDCTANPNENIGCNTETGCYDIDTTIELHLSQVRLCQIGPCYIPPEIGYLENLTELNLRMGGAYGEYLTGEVPPEIENLTNLIYFSIESNDITGISDNICNIIDNFPTNSVSQEGLFLQHNQLCPGTYPECIPEPLIGEQDTSGCSNYVECPSECDECIEDLAPPDSQWFQLEFLNKTVCVKEGANNVGIKGLSLRGLGLMGQIPPEIGNLTWLEQLDISGGLPSLRDNNNLSGPIPPEIGNLVDLNMLLLPSNVLSGIIPESICNINGTFLDMDGEWHNPWNDLLLGYFPMIDLKNNNLCPPYPSCIENSPILGHIVAPVSQYTEDCPDTTVLPPDLNQCRYDRDCRHGSICRNGDCILMPPPSSDIIYPFIEMVLECRIDRDCAMDEVCRNNACGPRPDIPFTGEAEELPSGDTFYGMYQYGDTDSSMSLSCKEWVDCQSAGQSFAGSHPNSTGGDIHVCCSNYWGGSPEIYDPYEMPECSYAAVIAYDCNPDLGDEPTGNSRGRDCTAEACISIENVNTSEGTLDIFMENSEPVAGFNFYLEGITITGISGGTADQYMDFINFNSSSGKIVGSSFSGSTIPAGSAILTQVTFSDVGDEICFAGETIVSDVEAAALYSEWGDCVCFVGVDCAGICGGSTAVDCNGDCGGDAEYDVCGECNGDTQNYDDCFTGDNWVSNDCADYPCGGYGFCCGPYPACKYPADYCNGTYHPDDIYNPLACDCDCVSIHNNCIGDGSFTNEMGECGVAYGVGDVNGDGMFNVQDIQALANCVLDDNCDEQGEYMACASNIVHSEAGVGIHNVIDIVALANCVLDDNCCELIGPFTPEGAMNGEYCDTLYRHQPPKGMTKETQNSIIQKVLTIAKNANPTDKQVQRKIVDMLEREVQHQRNDKLSNIPTKFK